MISSRTNSRRPHAVPHCRLETNSGGQTPIRGEVRVIRVSVGPSSTERSVLSEEQLGLSFPIHIQPRMHTPVPAQAKRGIDTGVSSFASSQRAATAEPKYRVEIIVPGRQGVFLRNPNPVFRSAYLCCGAAHFQRQPSGM